MAADMSPPRTQEPPGDERRQHETGLPEAEEVPEERERSTEANPEPMQEDHPVRMRRPPRRFIDEDFEYNLEKET